MGIEIHDNPGAERYEATLDGEEVGHVTYRLEGDRVVFTHTEVSPKAGGHGVGGQLAKAALDGTRQAGKSVVPRCPFVAGYIARHPEYEDLVPAAYQNLVDHARS